MSHFYTQPSHKLLKNDDDEDDEDAEIVAASRRGGYLHARNLSVRKVTFSRIVQVSHSFDVALQKKSLKKKKRQKKKKTTKNDNPSSSKVKNSLEEVISKMPTNLGGPYNDENLEDPGTVDYLIRELQISGFIDPAPLSTNQLEREMERMQWIMDNYG
tara:strand:- start:31718 stop:32191 length:474 start_codon:yes stop_codon:yes gene_type:complete